MTPTFVQERSFNSIEGFANKCGIELDEAMQIVHELEDRGMAVIRANGEADEFGDEPTGDARLQITFVGVAVHGYKAIVSHPKYFKSEPVDCSDLRLRTTRFNGNSSTLRRWSFYTPPITHSAMRR